METVLHIEPYTAKVVEATRFCVLSWRDGNKWYAACPEMKDMIVCTTQSKDIAIKICFTRICNAVVESKSAHVPVPWARWKPKTRGMYSVSRFSIA